MHDQNIRVRFAPSPTGYLHVGSLRTALYNYLFAKKRGGTYILRIEDTDQKRYVAGSTESLIRSLDSMGVGADEGALLDDGNIGEKGAYGPYQQSKRLALYKEYAEKLVASRKAYRCFCTAERLEEVRKEQAAAKQAPKYDKHCANLSEEDVQALIDSGVGHVIRLNIDPERGEIIFQDLVRGEVKIHAKDVDDQVLMKSDGFPTYHLANVVDDHLMEISHVIRGEEWLPSTPKHVLLYEAFGWELPEFAHLPLLLNPDRSKLSKRQGEVAVEDYMKKGYLKEALLNFVALLGWNPGSGSTQEIFSLEELVQAFDLANVHKGGAVFDVQKLDWMNSEYIKKLSLDELLARMKEGGWLEKDLIKNAPENFRSETYLKKVLTVEQERLARLDQVGENNPFFFATELVYDTSLLNWKDNTKEATGEALQKAAEVLKNLSEEDWGEKAKLETVLMEAAGEKRGDFLWPLRVALTGAQKSPSPFDVAWVLGRETSLARIDNAIKRLS
ncbi:MAG: glutamate--tRNA ligase [Candidatus Moranbacteria bacterium RIFCSPHIGHO2_01_FULL_55_24]|nr:MAG: glutamate--tRNA ligase [Candidatus Moranbacteria bacterium RIFCSPHIGHO2_01_FULL_55_24]